MKWSIAFWSRWQILFSSLKISIFEVRALLVQSSFPFLFLSLPCTEVLMEWFCWFEIYKRDNRTWNVALSFLLSCDSLLLSFSSLPLHASSFSAINCSNCSRDFCPYASQTSIRWEGCLTSTFSSWKPTCCK